MIFVLHYVDKKKMHVFEHFPSIKYFSSTITMSLKAIIEGSFSKHVICPIYTCFVFILIFYSYFFITFFFTYLLLLLLSTERRLSLQFFETMNSWRAHQQCSFCFEDDNPTPRQFGDVDVKPLKGSQDTLHARIFSHTTTWMQFKASQMKRTRPVGWICAQYDRNTSSIALGHIKWRREGVGQHLPMGITTCTQREVML